MINTGRKEKIYRLWVLLVAITCISFSCDQDSLRIKLETESDSPQISHAIGKLMELE